MIWLAGLLIPALALAKGAIKREALWSLKPLSTREVPQVQSNSGNPIDAFIASQALEKDIQFAGPADPLTWLRRVSLDLTGLPPTVAEQQAFLADQSPQARRTVVDRLLDSEQHGVRYARHWLDVLRYADLDENMPAAPGIHYWRDWMITALNQDLPYDAFARAQISGNRAAQRRIISAAGHLTPVDPRPEDLFALGLLSRGATSRDDRDQQLAFSAVETISSGFMGMTVACAKCHDHFYDPISQKDFYSMKALFDPLVVRPVDMATPSQVFERGRAVEAYERKLAPLVAEMRKFIEPYHSRLYEERLGTFPAEVQAAIRKPEKARTLAERKLHDDYYPILRIDPPKIKEVMRPEEVKTYEAYLKQINDLKPPEPLPVFWTVEEDPKRASETSYVLNTGDPMRPKKTQPVTPGFPLSPAGLEFKDGRRETFVDWLTSDENPLFARVAVNRIWQWHFGAGLHPSPSDFGQLGGEPSHPKLLDWLAAEFIAHKYSMKWLHRLIVTSDAYSRASATAPSVDAANRLKDPDNRLLWKFPLRRLEAEPIRDAVLAAAGKLNLAVGGASFDNESIDTGPNRRTAYLSRGYRSFADVMPDYLQAFDADDGRATCPRRTVTVTAPQALWLLNNEVTEKASGYFASRLQPAFHGDGTDAIALAFQTAIGRPPTAREQATAISFLDADPGRLKGLAWMLFNLDEFIYVR